MTVVTIINQKSVASSRDRWSAVGFSGTAPAFLTR